MPKLYTLLVLLLSSNLAVSQCLIQKIPLPARVADASVIIEGKVIKKYSFDVKGSSRIYTANVVEVISVFKGNTNNTITVFTEGGLLGDRMDLVSPSLQFEIGATGMLMLSANRTMHADYGAHGKLDKDINGHWGVSGPSSFIRYDLISRKAIDAHETFASVDLLRKDIQSINGTQAKKIAQVPFTNTGNFKKAGITSFSPTTVSGGTGTVLTIKGSGFGSKQGSVAFANADDGGKTSLVFSDSAYFISWSDTEVEIYVPQRAGTGKISVVNANSTSYTSSGDLTVTYTRLEIVANGPTTNPGKRLYRPALDDDNGNGGLTWVLNKDFKSGGFKGPQTMMRALQSWRCSTGVNFGIDTTNTTTTSIVDRDDTHTIMWQNPNQSISAGALGVTFSQWSGCYNASKKEWHWYLNDVDMVFDDVLSNGRTWNFGPGSTSSSEYDLESVALHEFGHAHQLAHIIDASGVMHYSIKNGEDKRTLNSNVDVVAGKAVMTSSTTSTGCSSSSGVEAMVEVKTNCKLINVVTITATYDASSLTGCAGDTFTFTSKSSPADADLSWRLPPSAEILNGTSSDEEIDVVFKSGASFLIGLLVEKDGFADSLYKNVNVDNMPNIAGRKVTDISCFGEDDGEVTLLYGSQGKSPHVIDYMGTTITTSTISNMAPGWHYFTIIDDNGCKHADSSVIIEPTALVIDSSGTKNANEGQANGEAWAAVSGGTKPYTYRWNDPSKQKDSLATGLSAGKYTVTITDDNDCETSTEVTVDEIVGIEEEIPYQLYPNPVSGSLYIKAENLSFSQAEILDLSGKKVSTKPVSDSQIELDELKPGSYILILRNDSKTYRSLIVKE